MKTPGKAAKIAIAAAVSGVLALSASSALAADRKTERALIGAVIGGVAGAALSNGDSGAVAIGALAGAALGATTADHRRSDAYRGGYRQSRSYGEDRQYDYRQARGGYGDDNRYVGRYAGDNRYAYGQGYDNRYAYGQGYDSRDAYDQRYRGDHVSYGRR